ncbi:MAG: hypothetical protein WC750_02570 [Patescibacteria group bacterium]|jgi:hypothetical protein
MNWKNLLIVLAVLFVAACDDESLGTNPTTLPETDAATCKPGAQVVCACPEGEKGLQICKADGEHFYPCDCPSVTEDAGHDAVATDAQTEATADAQAEADAGTDADAASDADAKDAKSEATADADAQVDAETGADADAEAGSKVILTISGAPGSPTEFTAGATGAKPHKLKFCTTKKIELTATLLYLQTISVGATTQGSMGTRYFRNIKLMDGTTTAMGPTELMTGNNETMPQRAEFHDISAMDAGTCKILDVVMDIWNVEDAPGELYSQVYQIQNIGTGAIVKAGGDEPVDRPMNFDEFLWTVDSNSAYFTVLPLQPVLEVKTSTDTFASDIIVAGKDMAYPFSKQDICNLTDQPVTFAYPYIQQACDGAGGDFTLVNATFEGLTGNMSSSAFDSFQIAFASGGVLTNVTVPAKSCLKATLSGKTQPVVPSINFPGDNTVSRSGHAPCLRLVKFAADGGVQIPTKYTPTDKPNPMVLRKVKPIVAVTQLASNTIFNGEMSLHCWHTSVDSVNGTDPLGYKQEMFNIETSAGIQLCNFRLYRGFALATGFNMTDAVFTSDLKNGCKPASQLNTTVAMSLANEDNIVGSGNAYCLNAVVLTSQPSGNSIATEFYRYDPSTLVTGQLMNNDAYVPFVSSPNIFNVGGLADPQTQLGAWHVVGDFVWSDQSEVPHTDLNLGSKDWTNSYLVQNLASPTVLSN